MSGDGAGAVRDPRDYLRRYWPRVPIRTRRLAEGKRGSTNWPAVGPPQIQLSADLDEPSQRAVLAHEMLHVERGPADEWERDAEEGAVLRQTARWLLPDPKLVYAAMREHGLHGAAELLGLPARVLLMRMRKLSRHEALTVYDGPDDEDVTIN